MTENQPQLEGPKRFGFQLRKGMKLATGKGGVLLCVRKEKGSKRVKSSRNFQKKPSSSGHTEKEVSSLEKSIQKRESSITSEKGGRSDIGTLGGENSSLDGRGDTA